MAGMPGRSGAYPRTDHHRAICREAAAKRGFTRCSLCKTWLDYGDSFISRLLNHNGRNRLRIFCNGECEAAFLAART